MGALSTLSADTIAYYRFEEGSGTDVVDSQSGKVHGHLRGGVKRSVDAVSLAGVSNTASLDFTAGGFALMTAVPFLFHAPEVGGLPGEATLEWFMKVPTSTSHSSIFWTNGDTNDDANRFNIYWSFDGAPQIVDGDWRDPSGKITLIGTEGQGPALSINQWHHIAIVRRDLGAGQFEWRWFFDGTEDPHQRTVTGAEKPFPTALTWLIAGRQGAHDSLSLAGLLDEIRVSNKALDPAEFLMQTTPPPPPPWSKEAGIIGISVPVDSCDSDCYAKINKVWSVQAPPFPLNVHRGVSHLLDIDLPFNEFTTLQDHHYVTSNVPDPNRSVVTYQFDAPVVITGLELLEHRDGITQVEAFTGNDESALTSIGVTFGTLGDVNGISQIPEGASNLFSFENTTPATVFRWVTRKTSLKDGWALYEAFPLDAAGLRIPPAQASRPPENSVLLVQKGTRCITVILTNSVPAKGGELGISFDDTVMTPLAVRPGADFPEGGNLHFNFAPQINCPPDSGVLSGIIIDWLNPADGSAPTLPGKHELLKICFAVAGGAQVGDCADLRFVQCLGPEAAPVRNIMTDANDASVALTTTDGRLCLEEELSFRRGDANNDGNVDISDPIAILGCLFLGTQCSACPDATDANDDGSFNIADPVYLLNWRFLGTPEPPAPFPQCGQDPTPDTLDECEGAPAC